MDAHAWVASRDADGYFIGVQSDGNHLRIRVPRIPKLLAAKEGRENSDAPTLELEVDGASG